MWRAKQCPTCVAKDSEIAFLRRQLEAEREERSKLLDRIMALSNPVALAHVAPSADCHTFATDEHGTTVLHGGEDREVVVDDDGDPAVMMDGELIKVSELQRWTARAGDEAAGTSPGALDA